jgi:hypothetical protein
LSLVANDESVVQLVTYLSKYTFNMAESETIVNDIRLDMFNTHTCTTY